MGIDGRITARVGPTLLAEVVDASLDGPQHYGDLREIRVIGGLAHVVGMGRTAYRRSRAGQWDRIDEGLRSFDPSSDPGLNSIDGSIDGDQLVAVGWGGEIWLREQTIWKQLTSPTNLALNRVIRLPNGTYVAGGQRGTLVHLTGDAIELIEQKVTEDDFYGMTLFRGQLFLSTVNGIFRWRDGAVTPVEIKSKKKIRTYESVSFLNLHATDDLIWSVGRKMAIYSEDGTNWSETPYQ